MRKISGLLSHVPSLGTYMPTPSSKRLIDSLGFCDAHARHWPMCQSGAHSTWHLWSHSCPTQRKFGLRHKYPLKQRLKECRGERRDGRDRRVGEMSYKDRLLALNLLPLTFDRELKDLIFFYKCLNNLTDLNVKDFVSFACHCRTRLSSSYNLKTPLCKTSTYQSSYFNRIVKLWNYICKLSTPSNFSTLDSFKNFVMSHLMHLLRTSFDTDYICTWTMIRSCPCHR